MEIYWLARLHYSRNMAYRNVTFKKCIYLQIRHFITKDTTLKTNSAASHVEGNTFVYFADH